MERQGEMVMERRTGRVGVMERVEEEVIVNCGKGEWTGEKR